MSLRNPSQITQPGRVPAGPSGLASGQLGRGALGMMPCDTRGAAPVQERAHRHSGPAAALLVLLPTLENGIST